MKKAYVKPVMESEAFVANEYVAACWTQTCTNCGEIVTCKHENENYHSVENKVIEGAFGKADKGCTNQVTSTDFTVDGIWDPDFWWLVRNVLGGKMDIGEAWDIYLNGGTFETSTLVHTVSVTSGWTNHPKASV